MQVFRKTFSIFILCLVLTTVLAAATIISEFHVKTVGRDVRLDWKTQQESNLKEFQVKRSSDQVNWILVGTVPAKNDGQPEHAYNFIDNRVFKGETGSLYYKLVLVDLQGQTNDHLAIASTAGISGIRHTWGSLKAMFR